VGSRYQDKIQRRAAEVRAGTASGSAPQTTSQPAPAQKARLVAQAQSNPVGAGTPTAPEQQGGGIGRQMPVRSRQFQSTSRLGPADRPLNLGPVVASANEVLEKIDTSMFSLGEVIYESRPPRDRWGRY